MNPVEVAAEVDIVFGPDLAQHLEEFGTAPVPFVVLEPGFAQVGELILEPPRDHVDGETAAREMVRGGTQLGQHARVPKPGMHGGDHLQPLGGQQ